MPDRPSFIRTASHSTGGASGASAIRRASDTSAIDPFSDPFGDSEELAGEPQELNGPMIAARRLNRIQEDADEESESIEQAPAPREIRPERRSTSSEDKETNDIDCQDKLGKCEDARTRLRANTLSKISVDITPSYKPNAKNAEELKRGLQDLQNNENLKSRVFKDRNGKTLGEGRLNSYANGKIVIIDEQGNELALPYRNLSEEDLCYVSAWWRLPTECTLGDYQLAARAWTPATMTWKASALCHKPLYFEETQLERYGHTTGPISQPLLSSAHFFTNIAVLPYKMGINPPTECQYPLGHYRPGSCAPWLLPPVPISVRGALMEAGTVLGGIAVIP